MIETYYAGIYWGVRKESVDECAERAVTFLKALSSCDPLLSHWFLGGETREEALKHEVIFGQEELRRLFLGGRNYTDIGHKLIESLGFIAGMWTGGPDGSYAAVSMSCGCFAPRPGINSCVLSFPTEAEIASHILQVSILDSIMRCMVLAWEPDWGIVTSRTYRKMVRKSQTGSSSVGWLTYLPVKYNAIPPLPQPAHIEPIDTQGALVIATDELFTASNPEHVEIVEELSAILDRAGLLK